MALTPTELRIAALLREGEPAYPAAVSEYLRQQAPASVTALGNLDILQTHKVALFCSVRCPGRLILQAYDVALELRAAGRTVVGGFHTPMEKECLALLLRGTQPVVVCPARSIKGMRTPREYEAPLAEGRLLLLSPFEEGRRRVTAGAAEERNRFVAALADEVLVAYAEPGGRTERLCREVLGRGKPLWTLDAPENARLIALGARAVRPGQVGAAE